jgi:uncharacterized membrane protein
MKTNYSYHMIAGQSLERLAALSDGIFAVAMTLLVLDLRVPVNDLAQALPSEQMLVDALVELAPRLLTYLLSFLTLGIFWIGQQTQLNYFARSNRNLTWIHLGFLMSVSLLPFSTSLLAEFISYRLAVVVYWVNLLLLGVMLYASWRYAETNDLVNEEATPQVGAANKRRILIYQAMYALAMLLCVISPYVSIGFLVLFQLNAAFAPRRLFDRLT